MSKKCAKCEKTVYPIEELKCLDKVWHKACFRCWECGMTLNMKNYKGYDKKPYCSAHYPTTKFTQVAVTPEIARITQNTKLQSQVHYKGAYRQSRGRCTSISDDVETLRCTGLTRKNSLVKYHEEYEKMKGQKQSVTDDPELLRHKQNTSIVSNVEYWGLKGKQADQESKRGLLDKDGLPQTQMRPPGGPPPPQQAAVASPYSSKNQGNSVVYSSQGKVEPEQDPRSSVGSIADYDPMNNQFGSITGARKSNPPAGSYGAREYVDEVPMGQPRRESYGDSNGAPPASPPGPVPLVPIGQPLAFTMHQEQPHYPPSQHQEPVRQPQQVRQPVHEPPPPPASNNPLAGAVFQALYDYEAKDYDEVGFMDGDIIINPEPIDEGWMYGTVKRTGGTGMLPANYVQRIQ